MRFNEVVPACAKEYMKLWLAKLRFPHAEIHSGWIDPTACFGPGCVVHRGAQVGKYVKLGQHCEVWTGTILGPCVRMGDYSYVNAGSVIESGTIGSYCSVGPAVFVGLAEHALGGLSTSPSLAGTAEKIERTPPVIGHDVWIGARAVILRGVSIATGSAVGAGAVVTRDVHPYEIVAGVPARHLGERLPNKVSERLMATQWWNLHHTVLKEVLESFPPGADWDVKLECIEKAAANLGSSLP